MTREHYLEMCEVMNKPVLEEDIPPEYDDFPPDVQDSIVIYSYLRDNWDYMGGNYIGKDLTNLFQLFDLFEIDHPSRKLVFQVLRQLDAIRQKLIQSKKPSGSQT